MQDTTSDNEHKDSEVFVFRLAAALIKSQLHNLPKGSLTF